MHQTGVRVGTKYFGTVVTTTVGIDKWYKREEGNEWRPIASSIMNELLVPPWSRDSIAHPLKKKVDPFHFSRLRRKADVAAEKRRRKREWLTKAYKIAKGDQDSDEEVEYRRTDAGHQTSSSSAQPLSRDGERCRGEEHGFSTLPRDEFSNSRVKFFDPHFASTESMKSRADMHDVRVDDRRSGKRQEDLGDDRRQDRKGDFHGHEISRQYEDDEDADVDEENVHPNYYSSNFEAMEGGHVRGAGDRAEAFGDDAEMLKWRFVSDVC